MLDPGSLRLHGPWGLAAPWEAWRTLPQRAHELTELQLGPAPEGRAADVFELLSSCQFPVLQRLRVISLEGIVRPLLAARFPVLRHLDWDNGDARAEHGDAVAQVLGRPWAAQLRSLKLADPSLAGQLQVVGACQQLEHLQLVTAGDDGYCSLSCEDVEVLAILPRLRTLDLELTRPSVPMLQALFDTGLVERVEVVFPYAETPPTFDAAEFEALFFAVQPRGREELRSYNPAQYESIKHRLRFEQVAGRLTALIEQSPVDYRLVWRWIAWLHPDHTSEAIEMLSAVEHWEPGPHRVMQGNPFDDFVTDRIANAIPQLVPWLSERIVRLAPEAGPWLGALSERLVLEPQAKTPPQLQDLLAQVPQYLLPVAHPLHATVTWCSVRDYYVSWKRMRHFEAALEALVTWEARHRGVVVAELRREVDVALALKALGAMDSAHDRDEVPREKIHGP